MQNNKVTPNYHPWCLSKKSFDENQYLRENLRLISTNKVNGGDIIVQTVEHRRFPFYGSHWHPEKTMNEFIYRPNGIGNINHDRYSVMVGQYFGNFFVEEARKNCNQFETLEEESNNLIFNYDQYLNYDGLNPKASYEERYVFPLWVNYNHKKQNY